MTHSREKELAHLEHLWITTGVTAPQRKRLEQLRQMKALEVAALASQLHRWAYRRSTHA